MKAPYRNELEALRATYGAALACDVTTLRTAMHEVGAVPALLIGAGGSMAVAQLGARLHEHVSRQPARACTSLEALDSPQLGRRSAVLFSSSAKHPDARRVLVDFARGRFAPAALVTHRPADDLDEFVGGDTQVVMLPPLTQPDGFLATGSILQTASLLLRAYGYDEALPRELDETPPEPPLRAEVLVLTPPSLLCVATDLEVRLVESGLAGVQVADYRNFAHGRHTGFARRSGSTTVIALADAESQALAEATVAALPPTTDVRRWFAGPAWEGAVVQLLVRSMRLAGSVGETAGIDVARPSVPAFGRRLYRLPLAKRVPVRIAGGIERKLLAAGRGERSRGRALYTDAAAAWAEDLRSHRFEGVVLDYDGTVTWTRRRWELPEPAIRGALETLLERGAVLGFASGRGRSLHADLRRWVPTRRSSQVVLGLYNGAVLIRLDEELPDLREPTAWSRSVTEVLERGPWADLVEIEERGAQVSVAAVDGLIDPRQLSAVVADELTRAGVAATVAASRHAVDIVEPSTTKVAVAEQVEAISGAPALAIGDQGQLGGNDHALLARGTATLTVDRCSADPGSCWFAGTGDVVGPALLKRYLASLRRRRGGLALTRLEVS